MSFSDSESLVLSVRYQTMSPFAVLAAFVLVYGAVSFYTSWRARKRVRQLMPPRPPGLPLLGNTLQIPFIEPWHVFQKWAEKYGELAPLIEPEPCLNVFCRTDVFFEHRREGFRGHQHSQVRH